MKQTAALMFSLLLVACAPPQIRHAPLADLQPAQVRVDARAFVGKPVRWGGEILSVQTKLNETVVEVLQSRLDSWGEPISHKYSGERFLARTERFLDPAIYGKGRKVTVAGHVAGITKLPIGETTRDVPVMNAKLVHLWRSYPDYGYRRYGYYPYPRFHFGFGIGHGHHFGHHLFHHHGFRHRHH
ncbi:MAG: Slp family lipoprotein [Chromatiales bacterium]